MSVSHGLLARILHQLAPHGVRVLKPLSADIVDELGRLELVSATEARLVLERGPGVVGIDAATRAYVNGHPDAVWLADLRASDNTGTITPFSPPHVGTLDVAVPIRVPTELRDRLGELRLPRDGDLMPLASLSAGSGRVAVLGMRAVAALDATDARRVTWWLPQGGALELLVVDDGADGTVLELIELVKEADAHTANSGPNVLVTLLGRAGLPVVEPGTGTGPPRATVRVLHPARSRLFDAWARYTAIVRQEGERREAERGANPIAYTDATQRGDGWVAAARLTPAQADAWLGPEPKEGRAVRVDQPAAVAHGKEPEALVTVDTMTLRGPGQVELRLKPSRGVFEVPPAGTLSARENKGEKVRLERERAALEILGKGAAACPRLPLLLGTPEVTAPPAIAPLNPAAVAALDPDQEAAVQRILGCAEIVAVQGPPGTGKTGVIAESLRQIAAKGRREGRTYRVLVSSVQNEAITNVLQRLADVEGVLVNVVERAARDEDEGFRFAKRVEEQRERSLKKLDARLARSEVVARLGRVREGRDRLEAVRDLAAVGPSAWSRLANQLVAIAEDNEAPLGHFAREEARALAAELAGGVLAGAEPTAAAAVRTEAPTEVESVPAWWDAVGSAWPAAHRAEVGAGVSGVAAALTQTNPLRRQLALDRALPRLHTAVAATRWLDTPAAPPVGPSIAEKVDAWLATASRAVRDMGEAIARGPDGVAYRFLLALREDPRAWKRIVERHGNTVAATCSMAAKAQPEPGEPYDWVIIDEAGRATPFELLIPMVQAVRIVLIGDHRQLPPSFDDAIARRAADDDGLPIDLDGLTLFGELFRLLPSTNAVRLGVQYRMHEAIGSMVDAIFYRPNQEPLLSHFVGGRVSDKWLVEVETPEGRRKVPRSRGVYGDAPVVWEDVASRGECTEENREEARAVVALLERYALAGVEPGDIAVICPYQRQRVVLEKALSSAPEARRIAEVRTIDAVQGREYAVVILCLVRTDGGAGFLASPNRLNVAISRAQRQLVIVGTATVFLYSDRVRNRAPHLHRVIEGVLRLDRARTEPK